jgi:CPA1 family monovalent cation:H+ antiporter
LIGALKLADTGRREAEEKRVEEFRARILAIEAVLERVRALAAAGSIPKAVAERLTVHHTNRLELVETRSIGDEKHQERVKLTDQVELLLLTQERDVINDLYVEGRLKDEIRRKIERELDLREANLASVRNETGGP